MGGFEIGVEFLLGRCVCTPEGKSVEFGAHGTLKNVQTKLVYNKPGGATVEPVGLNPPQIPRQVSAQTSTPLLEANVVPKL